MFRSVYIASRPKAADTAASTAVAAVAGPGGRAASLLAMPPRATDSVHHTDKRRAHDDPRREKRQRHTDHADAPH